MRKSKPRQIAGAFVVALGFAALVAQTGARAQQDTGRLSYARAFLQTGNFVVSSIDLPRGGGSGQLLFSADRTNLVPPGSDISAAYLYWEALGPPGADLGPARFHGREIATAKASRLSQLPPTGTSNCWGSSGANHRVLTMYRADVLHMLPKQYDAKDNWTGRYIVNDIPHPIELGNPGAGNTLTTVAGATLLLVYRDPSEPLRKIVIYDGVHAQPQGQTTTQVVAGFYESSQLKTARFAHLVGSGARNTAERLLFNGMPVNRVDPIPDPIDAGSDRGWASPVVDVIMPVPGLTSPDFGEFVTLGVDHGVANRSAAPYECLAFGAMVFSTAVADTDHDGLPDRLERPADSHDLSKVLRDPPTPAFPHGQPLPNLHLMGASVGPKDLFVEINAMTAAPNTTYGSATAPLTPTLPSLTDAVGHNHMPTPAVLKMVGDAYKAGGVKVRFDVGPWARYQSFGPEYACLATAPDGSECDARPYLVPSGHARGGELITERASTSGQFSAFPGTVGWPFGLQLYRDAPVGDGGEERSNEEIRRGKTLHGKLVFPSWDKGQRRRRFDRIRQDYVHYALYAHARGKAKNSDPNHPEFHVPGSFSGVAALPGRESLITLGLWDLEKFVGSTFVQASTTLHELGHNLNLWHGGLPATFGNKADGTTTTAEPNCKPNYLSSMSYAFQALGMFDDRDRPNIGYSSLEHTPALNEGLLREHALSPFPTYRPAWYVPLGSALAREQGASAARRYCDGASFTAGSNPFMARVVAPSTTSAIDWNGNLTIDEAPFSGDVNLDRSDTGILQGVDDWAQLRLDQIGAGRVARIFTDPNGGGDLIDFGSGDLIDFGSGDLIDFGSGDLIDFGSGTHLVHLASGDFLRYGNGDLIDFGSGDLIDFGSGTFMTDGAAGGHNGGDLIDFGSGDLIDFGSGDLIDFGSGDLIDFGSGDLIDFGSGDLIDFGSGDLIDFGSGTGLQELDIDTARALGLPRPYALDGQVLTNATRYPGNRNRVQLSWQKPTFDRVATYEIYRKTGSVMPDSTTSPLYTVPAPATTFVDPEVLPDGVQFTYWVRALFADGSRSPSSTRVVVTAINARPAAVADDPTTGVNYTTAGNTTLNIAASGVLANDSDVDGPVPSGLRVLVGGIRVNDDGSLTSTTPAVTINSDGSFTALTSQGGTVTLRQNGSFTYTPKPGFHGTDTFSYRVDNGLWPGAPGVLVSTPPSDLVNVAIQVVTRRR